MGPVIVQGNHLAFDTRFQHHAAPSSLDMLANQLVGRVHGHVAQVRGLGVVGHLEAEWIVGVEDSGVAGHLDHDPLYLGQLVEGADASEPQVIGLHIEHRPHVTVPDAHARPQQPAARDLEDGNIY